MASDTDEPEPQTLAQGRSRRTRSDKSGRFAALEKLKNLRGSKNKYEVRELENVYDVVDETTYSKTVQNRQKDDWIVDDGHGDYYEDGREIFDDELVDKDDSSKKKGKAGAKEKEKVSRQEKETNRANFQSVRDMLSNMPAKRKRPDEPSSSSSSASKQNDDDLLGDLMQELHEKKPKINYSSADFLQKAKSADDFVSSSRIREERPIVKPSAVKAPLKKKLVAYQIPQNDERDYAVVNDNDDIFSGSDDFISQIEEPITPSQQIDDFEEESRPTTTVTNAFKSTGNQNSFMSTMEVQQKEQPKKTIPETKLVEIESFESFGQLSSSDPIPSSDCGSIDSAIQCDSEQNKVMNFYWFDIYEEPKNPGYLYIFGKIPSSNTTYSSCCLVVKNYERIMYLLPKETDDFGEPITFLDVYNEFNNKISRKHKITTFKSRKVEKKYCFDLKDVPRMSEYLEVRYSGNLPALPYDLTGETFTKVFGSSSSFVENFLLEKKLKGPNWLRITNPERVDTSQQQSWCKYEFTCDVKDVSINEDEQKAIPPLVIASLNVQAVHDTSSKKDKLIFMCIAVNNSFNMTQPLPPDGLYHDYMCFLNRPPGEVWPIDADRVFHSRASKMDSERAMLGCFLAKLQKLDPDIYIGHDLNFELLILQMMNHKGFSKMVDFRSALAGRLVADVKISAHELIRARSYDLPSLASQILGMKEDSVGTLTGPEMKQLFKSSDGLNYLIKWGMQHCILNIRLINELQVMPLALQITTIAGNTLSRTLLGGRSERNEFLLLHAFHSKGYIVPDKFKGFSRGKKGGADKHDGEEDESGNVAGDKKTSSGPSYIGGLVLAPKKGFYDNFVILMDFNSLYPSIIQEFNICFTTGTGATSSEEDEGGQHYSERGVLPEEIRKLVESRRQVKNLMKGAHIQPDAMRQYDIRQKALKLTANSMYGCLGFRQSRFYAQELAAAVTGKGRDILMKTKDMVEKMGHEVIYGDTDSIMINSMTQDIQKVYQIGNKIKQEINRMYKLLELEIDGIFRFLLLLKKKKYAALLYNQKSSGEVEHVLELKGLDIVRRDWAPVAGTTAKLILDEIMTEQPLDDKVFKACKILGETAEALRAGTVPLKDLLITKQLAKNPEEYKDVKGQYHVEVARRMNESDKLAKKIRGGDTVSYLFCTDGAPHRLRELDVNALQRLQKQHQNEKQQREEGSSEEKDSILKPDPMYYLSQQVHPVVSRICEPIPGLDAARIADAIGIDSTNYKKRRQIEDIHDDQMLGQQTEAEKYRECEKFSFKCANQACRKEIVVESPFTGQGSEVSFTLERCQGCSTSPTTYINHIDNTLTTLIRSFIGRYYQNYYMCEDPGCTYRDRAISMHLIKGYPLCACKQALMIKEYGDSQLYRQLNYLNYIFDVAKHLDDMDEVTKGYVAKLRQEEVGRACESAYERLGKIVTDVLASSAYSEIRLGLLFQDLFPCRIKVEPA